MKRKSYRIDIAEDGLLTYIYAPDKHVADGECRFHSLHEVGQMYQRRFRDEIKLLGLFVQRGRHTDHPPFVGDYALKAEIRDGAVVQPEPIVSPAGGEVFITPPINEDFWLLRVKLADDQAVVAFPKFGMLGIGFQKETDWNTNLPWCSTATDICLHIRHNAGYSFIKDEDIETAVRLLQQVILDHNLDPERNESYHKQHPK